MLHKRTIKTTTHILALTACLFMSTLPNGQAFTPSADPSKCSSLLGSCDYYTCVEKEYLACGKKGYALGYAQKFCEKFSKTDFPEPKGPTSDLSRILFPAEGNAWVANVRQCLQEALDERLLEKPFTQCQEMREFGFSSHPSCYTTSPSFCELTPQNVARVGLVIGIPTLLTKETTDQIRETAMICVNQLTDRIATEGRPHIRANLRAYQTLWKLLGRNPQNFDRLMTPTLTPYGTRSVDDWSEITVP